MPATTSWQPADAGRESILRVARLVDGLGGELGSLAARLLARHEYAIGTDGGGPHRNVLGHPLFELPVWLDNATREQGEIGPDALLDICESSLWGYLSVRAEDDYFDGGWDDPHGAMMLAGFFRARHQALLAPLVSDRRFWARFESLWQGYAEAMLLERGLGHPNKHYGPAEFDVVLHRSQPLEIPGDAVLAIKGQWERRDQLADMVAHITKATQLFDDFIDAPDDLAAGNLTWMVRRLGGLEGAPALRRGMIVQYDGVIVEAEEELDRASAIAAALGMSELIEWAEARKQVMKRASERMYRVLFDAVHRAR